MCIREEIIKDLCNFIASYNGINNKEELALLVKTKYNLEKGRSIFYGEHFTIRFCYSKSNAFSNTVLSLSTLKKYDNIPFIVCLVTPTENLLFLANSTFLTKISHSSQNLRMDNIKGSFNGSDIMQEFNGIKNTPENFETLFNSHQEYSFNDNLQRLVEATNNISPFGKRFTPTEAQKQCVLESIYRAINFFSSIEYEILNQDLNNRVARVSYEIAQLSSLDNVNLRGRYIEYLITEENELTKEISNCLRNNKLLPLITTADGLGDYHSKFDNYIIETDIKTKMLFLSSEPKGYNIDKLLSFLSQEKSVYLVYIVAIDSNKRIYTRLCSIYHNQLLSGSRTATHWSGRNSRGIIQYDGNALEQIIYNFDNTIDIKKSTEFLSNLISESR